MSLLPWIGNISLNISLVLYFIVYIPQIVHNRQSKHIEQLSVYLHFILYLCYIFDLIYGFVDHLPWQYRAVSCVGLLLVTVQHLQLIHFFMHKQLVLLKRLCIIFLVIILIAICSFFMIPHHALNYQSILALGIAARGLGIVYCLPQIIKNKRLKSANAISTYFIFLNLSLAILDTLSAWCLGWGWPNKIAAPINIMMMLTMLFQIKKYSRNHFSHAYETKGVPI
jgi:hypothetical protein